MKTAKKVEHLIRRLGANGSYIGFHFTVSAVTKSIEDRRLLLYITKGVYLEVALENNTTVKCVERDIIRTVIGVIWKYGDRELLNTVAGRELREKPNNREFIDMLARFVEEEAEPEETAAAEVNVKEES